MDSVPLLCNQFPYLKTSGDDVELKALGQNCRIALGFFLVVGDGFFHAEQLAHNP